jgi:hypothetical protein
LNRSSKTDNDKKVFMWYNGLGKTHDLTISNGSTTYKITVSVLTYARSSVSNGMTERQNLGKALYRYYLASKAKFG